MARVTHYPQFIIIIRVGGQQPLIVRIQHFISKLETKYAHNDYRY